MKPKQTKKKTSRRTLSFLSMWSDGRLGWKAFVTVKWEAWDENNSKMADESQRLHVQKHEAYFCRFVMDG